MEELADSLPDRIRVNTTLRNKWKDTRKGFPNRIGVNARSL